MKGETNSKAELINFLISTEGQQAIAKGSEKDVHTILLKHSVSNRPLLSGIQAYEKISRLLFNAFYEMLQWMERHQSKGSISQLSLLTHVKKACTELPSAFAEADSLLEPFVDEALLFFNNFQLLRESFKSSDWIRLLFEHHSKVQRNKPPNGKASWVLEHSAGTYLLNTSQAGGHDLSEEYVHQYRTFTLQSFMKDLGKI